MRVLCVGFLVCVGCGGGSTEDAVDTQPDTGVFDLTREATTDGGSWMLSYVPIPDPIPPVDNFELLLTLKDAATGELLPGAEIEVVVGMPAHNHYMNTTPVVSDAGDGSYPVVGMQFHMSGHWQMDARVVLDERVENAVFHMMCCE